MSRKVNPRAVVMTRVRQEAYRDVARTFRSMPLWKRLKLALFARWY